MDSAMEIQKFKTQSESEEGRIPIIYPAKVPPTWRLWNYQVAQKWQGPENEEILLVN